MFFSLSKKKGKEIFRENKYSSNLNHIALAMNGIYEYSKHHKIELKVAWKHAFDKIKEIIIFQIEHDIPISSFNLIPMELTEEDYFLEVVEYIAGFLDELRVWKILAKKKIKISVIGKWYDLPMVLVDSIKKINRETRDYDAFFVNLCANYDGQIEIVDAFRVVAMKIKNGSLDPDSITDQDIKENLYSSYSIPPEIIFVEGGVQSIDGFLLWDSKYSKIYFIDKLWPELKVEQIAKIIQKIYSG